MLRVDRPPSRAVEVAAAFVVLLSAAMLAIALGLLSSCGAHREQALAADAFARTANAGGAELAMWSIERAPCEGLSDEACVVVARAQDATLWAAWDAFEAAHTAYASALEAGGSPSSADVARALCALVALLPEDAPELLLEAGSSCSSRVP